MTSLETWFDRFRRNTVGWDAEFDTPYGRQKLVYADWIASGRLYGPIEERMLHEIGPYVGNTHSESSMTGVAMTRAYHEARHVIKRHVNAGPDDVIIAQGSGMTGVVNKFQRILGLRVPEGVMPLLDLPAERRPVVFISHMEHHSNQTSWIESLAEVVCVPAADDGTCSVEALRETVARFAGRPLIGSFTSCSNVTGVRTPYHRMARVMHEAGGLCFVDFAASAPYDPIDMHPADPLERLDAIYFSPHKFLGGPGAAGILIFDGKLDRNRVPDHPGGGTVNWTNPWGEHRFVDNLEDREDGGTPGFLQTIRAALAIRLKEEMDPERMHRRERELLARAMPAMRAIPGMHLLADPLEDRLGVISFYLEHVHYNLVVRLLNDRYGIQVRGGCSCAGTYGHYLLQVTREQSRRITEAIDHGDLSSKPGWVRVSLHPTMTDEELDLVLRALGEVSRNADAWKEDYRYDPHSNEFVHRSGMDAGPVVSAWFDLGVEAGA